LQRSALTGTTAQPVFPYYCHLLHGRRQVLVQL